MPVLTTIEVFYALLVIVIGYMVFRSLSRSRMVGEIASEPLPERHEPDVEVINNFEEAKERVAETVKITEGRIEQLKGRATRLREATTPLSSRNDPACPDSTTTTKTPAPRSKPSPRSRA